MSRTNREILEIFGEYEKVVETVIENINYGKTCGSMKCFFYKEDYEEITVEMEETFNGDDLASICIEWNLSIS